MGVDVFAVLSEFTNSVSREWKAESRRCNDDDASCPAGLVWILAVGVSGQVLRNVVRRLLGVVGLSLWAIIGCLIKVEDRNKRGWFEERMKNEVMKRTKDLKRLSKM